MKVTVKMSCGHEEVVEVFGSAAERERKIAWYQENGKCNECKEKEKASACEEVEMKYSEYKTNYADCKTKKDSYDKTNKTIIVYVPVKVEEVVVEEATTEVNEVETITETEVIEEVKRIANVDEKFATELINGLDRLKPVFDKMTTGEIPKSQTYDQLAKILDFIGNRKIV